MDDIDFDYTLSKNTLSYIEEVCLDYKLKILKDLSENIDVSFKDLKEKFIDKQHKVVKYYGKPRDQIDETKCMARIWHSKLGPVQCSRSKLTKKQFNEFKNECDSLGDCLDDYDNMDLEPMFCKLHIKKLNYGRIDMPFEDYHL